ncbi:hypothetical protein [Pseudomonas sp. Q1]|uniref:hypothetical protein n=1 Tax=Pseudomonas sp. Q1 TaxID=2202823 RepID=UPI001374CD0F|nr:hypothetical protein [Pseudomonas sp. Q1]NCE85285.1 hypothetical protein [Pseudomonas sp. Q1]
MSGTTLNDYYEKAPSGLFLLHVYRGSELIDVIKERNLIVDGSKQIHAQLLGGSVANQSVTKIGFGTSTVAPAPGNIALTGQYLKALDGITYPQANQVSFQFSLGTSENNGVSIGEFGLFTGGNVLYARKTRTTAIPKASDLSFTGSWIISF